jgi:hypothetical protein
MFVYTNQVTTQISSYGGNPSAPVGGHVVSHASDYRFFTRVGAAGKRKISLKDNSGVPEFDFECEIGWGGIYKDKAEKKKAEELISEKLGSLSGPEEEVEEPVEEAKEVKKETKSKKTTNAEKEDPKEEETETEEAEAEVKVSKKKTKEATA